MTETFQHAEEHIVSHDDYDYYDVIIIKQLLSKSSSPNEAPKPKIQKGFKFLVSIVTIESQIVCLLVPLLLKPSIISLI